MLFSGDESQYVVYAGNFTHWRYTALLNGMYTLLGFSFFFKFWNTFPAALWFWKVNKKSPDNWIPHEITTEIIVLNSVYR